MWVYCFCLRRFERYYVCMRLFRCHCRLSFDTRNRCMRVYTKFMRYIDCDTPCECICSFIFLEWMNAVNSLRFFTTPKQLKYTHANTHKWLLSDQHLTIGSMYTHISSSSNRLTNTIKWQLTTSEEHLSTRLTYILKGHRYFARNSTKLTIVQIARRKNRNGNAWIQKITKGHLIHVLRLLKKKLFWIFS